MLADRIIKVGEYDDLHIFKAATRTEDTRDAMSEPRRMGFLVEIKRLLVEFDPFWDIGELDEDGAEFFQCADVVGVLFQDGKKGGSGGAKVA